ncbi:MAG: hypothetical protein ACRDT8_13855 [Micromonosporaceae bacterium]
MRYTTMKAPLAWSRAAALVLVAALATGCTGGAEPADTPDIPRGAGALNLKGDCPKKVVVQAAWFPQAESGALYHMVGAGYQVDAEHKSVTGPLVAKGKDTGVDIEIRAGGPAIGFQNAGAQMYADDKIHLAQVATDDAIGLSAKQPVVAVVSPLEIAPYMIMWDPKTHPEFHSIVDIGQTNTTVLYFKGATYMDYLVGSGVLRRSQVDGGYDGSPSRFVASEGKIAQQGFATSEPYVYEKTLPQWKRPVEFQLIHDTGYPIYPEAIVTRADRKKELAPCLRKLVPIIQQAQVDNVKDPKRSNALISKLVDEYKVGYPYPVEQAEFSIDQQVELGIASNGDDDTLGEFDLRRIKRVIDIVAPIYKGQRKELKAELSPEDLVSNEFIDPSIGMSA